MARDSLALVQAAADALAARRGLAIPPELVLSRQPAEPVMVAGPEELGPLYERGLGQAVRRTGGVHYTPAALADEVVEHALAPLLPGPPPRVCDPAMGGGAFLLAAARWLTARLGLPPEQVLAECLHGVDLDPGAVAVARLSLWLYAPGVAPRHLLRQLVVGDALSGRLRSMDEPDQRGLDWPAAFPAVMAAGGFDAVVGNPPFLGGSFLTGAFGAEYREHLVHHLAGGRRGAADLCAYFLLRAHDLLRPGGYGGLVLTNTIAEGATRQVGLEQLLQRGGTLVRAERQQPWPGSAAPWVSLVWWRHGGSAGAVLDGTPVPRIGPDLRAAEQAPDMPQPLPRNRGLAFNGTKIYGQGFLLTAAEAGALLAANPRHADVIRPYLGGEDVYGPHQGRPSRWVICFHDWPLSRAEEYPQCLELVRRRVKPERDRLAGRNSVGDQRAARWWRFGASAAELYAATATLQRVLVKVIHSDTHQFVWAPANCVFSHALAVFATESVPLCGVLQSSLHRTWARWMGSSLGSAPRYTLSRTFLTFPLPELAAVAPAAAELEQQRAAAQAALALGWTALDRRFHDATKTHRALLAWRTAQRALDEAVLEAYGWPDLAAGLGWHADIYGLDEQTAATAIARLLELNAADGNRPLPRGAALTERA